MKKVFDFYADIHKKNKEAFNDALPIGNGHIGGMIYGDPEQEKIILNDNTFWLGNKKRIRHAKDFYTTYKKIQDLVLDNQIAEAEKLAALGLFPNPKGEAIYSVAGQLNMIFPKGEIKNYSRTLHLDEGYVRVEYLLDNQAIKRTYFASYPNDVIGIEIESDCELEITCQLDREKLVDSIIAKNNQLKMLTSFNRHDYCCVEVQVKADYVTSIGATLVVRGKHFNIWVSLATTLYCRRPAVYTHKTLAKVNQLGLKDVFDRALKDYLNLYRRQQFNCDDSDMTYMYNFSRYLMIAASRKNLPANLQGIWNQDIFPAWDSKYTININLQMNYWHVFSSNLEECFYPFLKLLEKMYSNGKALAKKLYHVDGFVAHHNTDIYGDCGLQDHYLPATIWPLGVAWLTQIIYDAYDYTMNQKYLKRYGYLMSEAAKFILNVLKVDSKGYLVLCPTLSPENSYYKNGEKLHLCVGCTMDDEIIYDLFSKTMRMNELLNIDFSFTEKLKEAIKRLAPLKKSRYETIAEWHEDYEEAEPGHRHISHLYGLYPSNQIKEENQEFFTLAKNTLVRRLENGGGHTGWSKAWITAMWARLKCAEECYQSFQEFIKNSTSRVGLDLHPPFQIDGNFGIAAAIKEMFVYDELDYVEIFPAKPLHITCLEFTHIKLKGNLDLSISFKNNQLTLTFISECIKTITLKMNRVCETINLSKGKTIIEKKLI